MNKRSIGSIYEQKAAVYLESRGVKILERNFRCRTGEVDLIAKDGKYLVFIEVKYRLDRGSGSAAEAVSHKKQRVISRVADYYLVSHCKKEDTPCRFDVVTFDGEKACWYQDAFAYCPKY
ncbi:MAG: YraN family protein [Eubacteriales bacterium]|nr:YraN family protein [Eubacteriales bacterium]